MQIYDLTAYLTDNSNYTFPHEGAQSTNSKISISSNNELLVYYRTIAQTITSFCDTNDYTLEFEMKNSEGYDLFIQIGDTNKVTIINQQYSFIVCGDTTIQNARPRYTNYIPIKIIREGNDFAININNGQYNDNVNMEDVNNILRISKYGYSSSSNITIRNLKITH